MTRHKIFSMASGKVYPAYLAKAEKKGRTKAEVDEVIRWQTGYTQAGLEKQIAAGVDLETFYAEAPKLNPALELITGVVCGVRVEAVEDPQMREIRYLDKLAKGKAMGKILSEYGD